MKHGYQGEKEEDKDGQVLKRKNEKEHRRVKKLKKKNEIAKGREFCFYQLKGGEGGAERKKNEKEE